MATVDGDALSIETLDPAGAVATVMQRLGAAASRVRSEQLNAIGFPGATVLGAIGGALVPLSTLPAWTHRVAPARPSTGRCAPTATSFWITSRGGSPFCRS